MSALQPSASLIVKLCSIVVHVDEFFSPTGHEFDKYALDMLMKDSEVIAWVKDMTALGFAPVKR